MLVERRILEADLLHLLEKQTQQVELLRRARIRLGVLVGLRIDADVAKEALGGVLGKLGRERRIGAGSHGGSVPVS